MPEPTGPEYPRWIVEIFEKPFPCTTCRKTVTLDDIIGIGVQVPCEPHIFVRDPRINIFMRCPHCSQQMGVQAAADKMQILSAVESAFDVIKANLDAAFEQAESQHEASSPTILPSPNYGPLCLDDDDGSPVFDARTPAQKRQDANRQRREGQLKRPPDDREVEVFLNKLKATSFKLSSKSYRKFMRELGIDLPDETEGD